MCGLLFLVMLGACSGGDEPTAAPTPTASTTTTGAPTTTTTVLTEPSADDAELADQLEVALASGEPWAGRFEQRAVLTLLDRPGRQQPVLDALLPAAREHLAADLYAGTELRTLTKPRTALPDNWTIQAPADAAVLRRHYDAAERATGVPWHVLAAVHMTETRMGRIRGDSTAGARGPMQFLPSTWEQYGEGGDIEDDGDAIMAAARMLRNNGAPGDIPNALYAYNHAHTYVHAVVTYSTRMSADPNAFTRYHAWQVAYRMVDGVRLLPEGWPSVPESRA